jgi:prepilin-type N-terminal cleavage/methylation domain-containing protein
LCSKRGQIATHEEFSLKMARTRQPLPKSHLRRRQKGFTLIETLVIMIVIGVLAAVAGPNLAGLLDAIKVNQTVAELRTALQETQRQAIRKNQPCELELSIEEKNNRKKGALSGSCLVSGTPSLPEEVEVATNVAVTEKKNPQSNLKHYSARLNFSHTGSADFMILSNVKSPALPKDPSAKIVALIPDNKSVTKRCVAVSSTLGLTRVGTYTGEVSPTAITDEGICTALDWKEQ